MNLPFKEGIFDTVFSLGVLHHTSNAEKAFEEIAKLVKRKGKLAVWVYANDGLRQRLYNAVAACYRTVTTRISKERLYRLCACAVPLYYLHKSKLGFLTRVLMPTSMDAIPEWRWLDTFDWYAPKYQSKHTYKQVEGWFERVGFSSGRLPFPTSMQGTKPP